MKNSTFPQVILVAVLVMTMNVQFGLAQLQNPSTCFSNFDGVRGCLRELNSALSSGKADYISLACCKVVKGTSDFCLMILFPNPAIRIFLKLTCSYVKNPPASAPVQTPATPSTPIPPQPSPPSQPSPSDPSSPSTPSQPSSPSQPPPSQPSSPPSQPSPSQPSSPSTPSQPSTPSPSQPSSPTTPTPSQPSPSQPSTPSEPTPGTSAAAGPKAESAQAPSG